MPNQQRCPCPYPPGGEVICEHDEMPFCLVTPDGKRKFICKRLKQNVSHVALLNEVLSIVYQLQRPASAALNTDDFEVLEKQYFEAGEYIINFTMTTEVRQSLEYLINSTNRGLSYDTVSS
ncbi:MAG: hypothetical protein QM802_22740 [Agriterribacter sp.]